MILILDNYDSFTHNLFQYMSELTDKPIRVVRNDAMTADQVEALSPEALVISPGPGRPEDAGISEELILRFMGRIPILGVCLGHQAIAHALGGRIVGASRIVHGKAEDISTDGKGIFRSIQNPARFTRYHSLAVDEATLPDELEVSARSADGQIMGIRHKSLVVEGVQFHPESIASEEGKKLLRNFLNYRREPFDATATLEKVISKKHLARGEAALFMDELTEGNLSEIQIAAFLGALATKGVSPDEIAGCAQVLQKKRVPLETPPDKQVLDTCGTGGDSLGTYNISSFAALIASSAGACVAKHGNRGVSSRSGSADFYQALGIEIQLSPDESRRLLGAQDFAFLFAPNYHSAMKYAAPVRKALRVKTLMNLMGPLLNPAGAQFQLLGVYSEDLCLPMAQASQLLGSHRVMVVHGLEGLDELSVCGPSRVVVMDRERGIEDYIFDPATLGIPRYSVEDLRGGDAAMNASAARVILGLEDVSSLASFGITRQSIAAYRDAALLNAGASLYVLGLAKDFRDGYQMATQALDSGKAGQKTLSIIQMSLALKGSEGSL